MCVAMKNSRHLSDIANISLGRQLNRSTLSSTGSYPVYNGGMTASGYTDKFNTDANQIIVSQGGESAGFVNYITAPFWAGAHCYVVQPATDKIDKRYLYFYLKSMQRYLQESRTGSSIPGLSKSKLSQFPVQVPSIAEQKTASGILTNIENAISLNDDLLEMCSKVTEMLYDYWFVQFNFPDENGRPYKSSGGKMVYNEQLKQEVPEGWKVSNLANTNLATVIKPGINNFIGEKTYLATGDVNGDNISNKAKSITYTNRESRANMQPTFNSVWFAKMKDSVKHIIITDSSSDLVNQCILSTGFCGLQANSITLCYLAAYISQPQFEQTKNMLAHGATQKAISNSDLSSVTILEPDDATLQRFAGIVYPMLELIDNCRQQSKQLASLRDWLLPMLMNGQVEIRERKEASNDQV